MSGPERARFDGGPKGGNCPILFSNDARAAARCRVISTLLGVCVLYVLMRHLMGSAGCRAARLKSQSVERPHATESAPSSAPSLGRRSARELGSTSCLVTPA